MTPIDEVAAGYAAAVSAADVDAFVALYDDEVRVFDTWGRWSYDGLGEWRAMVGEWFGSLGDERPEVELHDIGAVVGTASPGSTRSPPSAASPPPARSCAPSTTA